MNLLLVSSSNSASGKYFEHCQAEVKQFLDSCPPGQVLFVPYALHDWDGYANQVKEFFTAQGYSFASLHQMENPREAIENHDVKAVYTGGGNSFRLLKALQDRDLLETIRQKVQQGAGYMGASAGSNMACPTIMTTNDMPIAQPLNFKALGFVSFQINPHFVPGPLIKGHQGETREERIAEYLEENERPVIGLPEASWIRVQGSQVMLGGTANAVIFERNAKPREWHAGSELVLLTVH